MASANVVELNASNWETEVSQSDKPVLVDFWAPWCYPCRVLGPTIDKIADQFAGKVKVGKLNTDQNPEIAGKYRIDAIPQIFLFKGSPEPVEQMMGAQSEASLVSTIQRHLNG